MNAPTQVSANCTRPRGALLPFEPLEVLAARSPRLANLVESISRRRDVRDLRARLLVLLLELRCPPSAHRPRRSWYVRGAVARLGLEALRRAWRSLHSAEAPSSRTLRTHLGVLERVMAVVRQPGEYLASSRARGLEGAEGQAFRPRHADTLHVLEDERAADWWARNGAPALARAPAARRCALRWRKLFGLDWRSQVGAPEQRTLFERQDLERVPTGPREGLPDRPGCPPAEAERVREEISAAGGEPLALLLALARAGARVLGRPSFELAGDPARLRGAAGLFARALLRGDVLRNRAAWLVRAFRHAPRAELSIAAAWLGRAGYPATTTTRTT